MPKFVSEKVNSFIMANKLIFLVNERYANVKGKWFLCFHSTCLNMKVLRLQELLGYIFFMQFKMNFRWSFAWEIQIKWVDQLSKVFASVGEQHILLLIIWLHFLFVLLDCANVNVGINRLRLRIDFRAFSLCICKSKALCSVVKGHKMLDRVTPLKSVCNRLYAI